MISFRKIHQRGSKMEIKKVCVLGAGLMGSGIAQVCAQAGYEVTMRDIEQRFIEFIVKHLNINDYVD